MRVRTDDNKISGDVKVMRVLGGTTQTEVDGEVLVTVPSGTGGSLAVATKTATYTVLSTDTVLLGNAVGGSLTFNLPPAATVTGLTFLLRKVDSSGNSVLVDPNGSETIDGSSATITLANQWDSISIVSDGSGWQKVTSSAPNPGTAGASPWSTTLASGITAGATAFTTTDLLPQYNAFNGGGDVGHDWFYLLIDPWTVNAELRQVRAAGSKTFTSGTGGQNFGAFAHNHSSGAAVILVEDHLHVDWFGAEKGFGSSAANIPAFNAMFAQAANFQNGYTVDCRYGPGAYFIPDQIVLPTSPVGTFTSIGAQLICTSDFGAGKFAVVGATAWNLNGISVQSNLAHANTLPSFATWLASGFYPTPPVLMNGIYVTQRMNMTNCGVAGFNSGFVLGFPDHTRFIGCKPSSCFYGYYFSNSGGISGGDQSYQKCDSESMYRAHWAVGPGNGPEGVTFKDCSWFGAPWVVFCEGGASGGSAGSWGGVFENCNQEFIGNGYCYFQSGSSGAAGFGVKTLDTYAGMTAGGGGSNEDTNYPISAAVYNDSGQPVYVTTMDTVLPFGSAAAIFDSSGGGFIVRWNKFKAVSNCANPIFKSGFSTPAGSGSFDSTVEIQGLFDAGTNGRGETGFGTISISTGTVGRGDLLEFVLSGTTRKVQVYQTAGAPWFGQALHAASSNSVTVIHQPGSIVRLNVNTGNSVSAGKYVKPDGSNNGCVVQASGFSDGPIVGRTVYGHETGSTATYGTGSDRSVLVMLGS